MPATWTISQGTPSDAVGAQGDLNFDSTGRFIWGPKGATSWAGTANNVTVTQNASMLTGQSITPTQLAYGDNIALTPTPKTLTIPGTTIPYTFFPLTPSAFSGFYAYSSVAVNVRLFNQTANASVYTTTLNAGTNTVVGPFAASAYPLLPNNVYVWQAFASSGTATMQIQPYYLGPANSPGLCVGTGPLCGYSGNQTFTATSIIVPVFGTAPGANYGIHTPLRTSGIYSAIATYTPSAGTPATASIKPVLSVGSISSGAITGSHPTTFASVTATGLPQVILPPQTSDVSSLTPANYYVWSVTGSGAGSLQIQLIPLV